MELENYRGDNFYITLNIYRTEKQNWGWSRRGEKFILSPCQIPTSGKPHAQCHVCSWTSQAIKWYGGGGNFVPMTWPWVIPAWTQNFVEVSQAIFDSFWFDSTLAKISSHAIRGSLWLSVGWDKVGKWRDGLRTFSLKTKFNTLGFVLNSCSLIVGTLSWEKTNDSRAFHDISDNSVD